MNFLAHYSSIVTAVAVFSLILSISYHYLQAAKAVKAPPEAKGAWPVIGHLHILRGSGHPLHLTLADMADQYGPLFRVRLGLQQAVVVSGREVAKECFTKHDLAICSRPKLLASEYVGYNYAMFGIAPHGPYWREMRKICIRELLSSQKLELLKHIRVSQVESSVKELYKLWGQKKDESGQLSVEIKQWFCDLISNIIIRMMGGNRSYAYVSEVEKVYKLFQMLGILVVADYLPFLRWLDLGGHESFMKKTSGEVDSIVQGWLDERRRRKSNSSNGDQQDFIDALLSTLDETCLHGHHPDSVCKSTIVDMIGSTETMAATLTWAFSLLVSNRSVLNKAQDELEMHIGRKRQVNESDISKLVYLQAIVKETLRLYPAAPLGAQHLVTRDCTIDGYHVPRGTRLIVNLYQIQRDPRVWEDRQEFKPERFLTTHLDVDVRGSQNFELIPFGAGRRKCPGAILGLNVVHFTLASLLHGFEFSAPSLDMTASAGLTSMKDTPLPVLVKPRLSSNLYE